VSEVVELLEIVPSSLSTSERRLRYTIHYGTVEMFRDCSEQSVLLDDIAEHLSVVASQSQDYRN
jgi:hypothetical protein